MTTPYVRSGNYLQKWRHPSGLRRYPRR